MEAAKNGTRKPASLRTIWAIAKSPELALSEDDLHALVYRETRKGSLRQLTQGEINTVTRVLQNMKDSVKMPKRTNAGGDPRTERQRCKIYALCAELGWNDDNRRINAFVKRMFAIDRLEWLNQGQCYRLIEALKAMVARQQKEDADEHGS